MNRNWRHARPRWMRLAISGCLLAAFSLLSYHPFLAQSAARRFRTKVEPEYPELAKKNNITGSVRVSVVVAPDGKIKEVKVLGGNPVLAQAVVAAMNKSKYEPATEESTIVLKFDFNNPTP